MDILLVPQHSHSLSSPGHQNQSLHCFTEHSLGSAHSYSEGQLQRTATCTGLKFFNAVAENTTYRHFRHPPLRQRNSLLSPCTYLLNTYIFFLQIQDVIDSFFHILRESCHSHTIGVRSSALGKANIHLQHKEQDGTCICTSENPDSPQPSSLDSQKIKAMICSLPQVSLGLLQFTCWRVHWDIPIPEACPVSP